MCVSVSAGAPRFTAPLNPVQSEAWKLNSVWTSSVVVEEGGSRGGRVFAGASEGGGASGFT